MDNIQIEIAYQTLGEALSVLDNVLFKKDKQGKQFLVTKDKVSNFFKAFF